MEEIGVERAICVWNWGNLPDCLKEFMEEEQIPKDDADWFALKPSIYKDDWIPWLEEPVFGCWSVKEYPIGTLGYTFIVGYHS